MLAVAARPVVQPRTERTKSIRLFQLAIAGGDLAVIVLATALAAIGRYRLDVFRESADITEVAQSVGPWVVLGWMLVNLAVGTYRSGHLGVGTTEYAKVLAAAGFTGGAIGIISYLTKFNLSRGFFVLLFVFGVPLLLLWRWTARRLVHRLHLRGYLVTKVLIAGSAPHVDEVAAVLDRESWLGYRIIGALRATVRRAPGDPARGAGRGPQHRDRTGDTRERGRPHRLHRGRPAVVDRLPAHRLGPRGPSRADGRRAEPQRHLVRPHDDASRRRRAPRPRRAAAEPRGLPRPEARLRSVGAASLPRARPASHDRVCGPRSRLGDGGPDALPADPRLAGRRALRVPQVPQHGRRRRGSALRRHAPEPERRRRALQGPAAIPRITRVGALHPPVLHRRAAAAGQRHRRRDEPRRSSTGPAGGGAALLPPTSSGVCTSVPA